MISKRKILFISGILLLFCICAVSAESDDTISDDTLLADSSDEQISLESSNSVVNTTQTSEESKITVKNAKELINEINDASNTDKVIYLTKDISLSEQIIIKNDITIEGNGHTINANGKNGIFKIRSKVTIQNVVFKKGNADRGGAIYNSGSLTIDNCKFIKNKATYNGGAIFSIGSKLTITNSEFTGNHIKGSNGGAVNSASKTVLTKCVFENNYIKNNKVGANGGALFLKGDTEITKCVFKSNYGDASYSKTTKKGVSLGGAIFFSSGNFKLTNCKFSKNYVTNHGGAIFGHTATTVTINNCKFTSNKAKAEDGAAISYCGKKLTIKNSQFSKNKAYEDGGAIDCYSINKKAVKVTIKNSVFDSNMGKKGAGAIWCGVKTKVSVSDCDFTNNKATIGGAVYVEGKSASFTNCLFKQNTVSSYSKYSKSGTVIKPSGGAFSVKSSLTLTKCKINKCSAVYGGGIYAASAKLILKKCTLSKNKAYTGGAIYMKSTSLKTSGVKYKSNKASHASPNVAKG